MHRSLRRHGGRRARATRVAARLAGGVSGAALALMAAAPVAAHGGATGAADVLQDYGVLLFVLAVVLVGAGVLAWVLLTPQEAGEGDGSA